MRVVADHSRAASFLIADGVLPSNEGRGYVLRRILRRAIRHAQRLSNDSSLYARVCGKVIETMSDVYPELSDAREHTCFVVAHELLSSRRVSDETYAAAEKTMGLESLVALVATTGSF